ncbi:MAG: hypothetical protein ACPGWS_00460 [Solirubrobacterales bacterium]
MELTEGGPAVIVVSGSTAQFTTVYEPVRFTTVPLPEGGPPLNPVISALAVAVPHVGGFL